MAEKDTIGPHLVFTTGAGFNVPLYLVKFGKDGQCQSDQHRKRVLDEAAGGAFTDVHIYSHGWNNVFPEVEAHYTEFFTRYFAVRKAAGIDERDYRPLIAGVIWPSTALVSKGEAAPTIAGGTDPEAQAQFDASVSALGDEIGGDGARRLAELTRPGQRLDAAQSAELARLLAPVVKGHADPGEDKGSDATAEDLLRAWGGKAAPPLPRGVPRPIGSQPGPQPSEPDAAALPAFLDPRELVRKATVFVMKDRAGRVGREGVGPFLAELLDATTARVHLTGHSFGAKVVLSALSAVKGKRPVESVLLMQPAINAYCFAGSLPDGDGTVPGAYRNVLDKTRQPVFTTFSTRDLALREFFYLALRRKGDLGDIEAAALESRYAALGAVGASGMRTGEYSWLPMTRAPARYAVPDAVRVLGLDGSAGEIRGHGDVRNEFTAWVLACLVQGGMQR